MDRYSNANGPIRYLQDEELTKVLTEGGRYGRPHERVMWAALFSLLGEFGPRVSELWYIRRADVDFRRGELTIPTLKRWRTLKDGSRERVSKTRTLPMRPWLADVIRKHLKTAPVGIMLFPPYGDRPLPARPLTAEKSPWRTRVWRAWKACCERAGIPHHRVHDARHTVATRLAEVDIILAQNVLDHSSLGTTSKYVHLRHMKERFLAAPGAINGTAA